MADETERLRRLLAEAEEKNEEQRSLLAEAEEKNEEQKSLLALMGVLTVEEAKEKYEEAKEKYEERGRIIQRQDGTIRRQDGSAFCTVDELFAPRWEAYSENDFTSLCRNWEGIVAERNQNNSAEENQHSDFESVFLVYDTTRTAAMVDSNKVSTSTSLMTVEKLKPVRLCSHENVHNYAEKAHLCPKTGPSRKVDTWIYVAAAVLGMPYNTLKDREALLKALRGSVKEGKSSVTPQTGLNRSPFNLISFLLQETWFDKHPGVIVLPCLEPTAARNWRGESYSIIILCRDVPFVSTAENVATSIALGTTPREKLHAADADDIEKARLLLRQVLLSSAFCLMTKDGPPNTSQNEKRLWDTYKEGLVLLQRAVYAFSANKDSRVLESVLIPELQATPDRKFVAKINLSEMTPPESEATPAFPDPLLLAFKSSVNWTRAHGFQMMAEAEPPEDDVDFNNQIPGMVVMIDKGSVRTPDDGSSHTS